MIELPKPKKMVSQNKEDGTSNFKNLDDAVAYMKENN